MPARFSAQKRPPQLEQLSREGVCTATQRSFKFRGTPLRRPVSVSEHNERQMDEIKRIRQQCDAANICAEQIFTHPTPAGSDRALPFVPNRIRMRRGYHSGSRGKEEEAYCDNQKRSIKPLIDSRCYPKRGGKENVKLFFDSQTP